MRSIAVFIYRSLLSVKSINMGGLGVCSRNNVGPTGPVPAATHAPHELDRKQFVKRTMKGWQRDRGTRAHARVTLRQVSAHWCDSLLISNQRYLLSRSYV
jgi:hypothetical protein